MHIASLLPRRALEWATGAVIAVAAFLAVLLPLQVGGAVDDLARAALAAGAAADVTLTIELPIADDPDAQDAAVRQAVVSSLGAGGAGIALDVSRERPDDVLVRWTIAPRADEVTAANLDAVPAAWRRTRTVLAESDVDTSNAAFGGSLVPTALAVSRQADAVRGAAPIAMTVAATIAFVAVNEIARLLAARGARRSTLLWSRGARLRRLVGDATLPSAVAALAGWCIGALAGAAVAGRLPLDAAGWATVGWSIAIVPIVVAVVAGHAVASVRALERPDTVDSPRARTAVRVVAVALLVALAGFAGWQLLLFGSSPPSVESARTNPVTLLAPASALAALTVLALTLVSLLRGPTDRLVDRRVPWFGSFWLRGAFRRGALSVAPLLLCALALGQLVVAAGYAGSWSARYDTVAAARWGTAVRMDAGGQSLGAETLAAAGALDGVSRVAPIRVTGQSLAAQSVSVMAVTAPAVADLAAAPPEVREGWADALAPAVLPGWAVSGGERLALSFSGSGVTAETVARAYLGDEDGLVVEVDSTVPDASGTATLTVPADAAQWQLFAIDIGSPSVTEDERAPTIAVVVSADGVPLDTSVWTIASPSSSPIPADADGEGRLQTVFTSGVGYVRFLAGVDDGPLPVVVTTGFLDATGLSAGERFSLSLWGLQNTTVQIAAVTPALPGADSASAVMIDAWVPIIGSLAWSDDPPDPTVAWIGAADDPASAAALRGVVPEGVRVNGTAVDPARDIVLAAPAAMWWGAAAAAVLALLGTAAVALAGREGNAAETAALRMIGLGARGRRAARGAERAAIVVVGLVVGMLAGAAVVALLVPSLARGAAPSGSIGLAQPVFEARTLAWSAASFVVALVLVVAGAIWREPRTGAGE